jgi:peptidoglycan LD-endopeptidase CwlK
MCGSSKNRVANSVSQHGVLIGIALYFALACAALAWLFLPHVRGSVIRVCRRGLSGGQSAAASAAGWSERQMNEARAGSRSAAGNMAQLLRLHARWIVLATMVVSTGPVAVLLLRDVVRVDGFDHTASRATDERVATLLQGEQLVPPPPLPPELFVTRELEQVRPMVRYASREWALLDEDFRRRLLLVFRLMREEQGYELALLEGYRSPERQAQLAALGPAVTQADAYESYHQFGLAADVAFLRGGRIVLSEQDPWAMRGYALYGAYAQSVGLVWGGGWRSLKDYGHAELPRPGVLNRRGESVESTSPHVH